MSLRIVVDMNLSLEWVPLLEQAGWSAVHWSSIGDPRADDATIIATDGNACETPRRCCENCGALRRFARKDHCIAAPIVRNCSTNASGIRPFFWIGTS